MSGAMSEIIQGSRIPISCHPWKVDFTNGEELFLVWPTCGRVINVQMYQRKVYYRKQLLSQLFKCCFCFFGFFLVKNTLIVKKLGTKWLKNMDVNLCWNKEPDCFQVFSILRTKNHASSIRKIWNSELETESNYICRWLFRHWKKVITCISWFCKKIINNPKNCKLGNGGYVNR